MNLVCIGSNHRACPLEVREKIAFPANKLSSALEAMREILNLREWFLLSTCNRVELYGYGAPGIEEELVRFLTLYHGISQDVFNPYLYRYQNRQAARHLFRVTSGLDSLVVGENEIYEQVKTVFQYAKELKAINTVLTPLTEDALRIGRRVREETRISEGTVSVASIAVMLAKEIFGSLTGKKVLMLGTGTMSVHTIKNLLKAGVRNICVANRTPERAIELSARFDIEAIAFSDWQKAFLASDIVISSTASPEPIVRSDTVQDLMVQRKEKPVCIIDIAVPRDIEASAADIAGVHLYNIDDLKLISERNLEARKKEVAKCEEIIAQELANFDCWFKSSDSASVAEADIKNIQSSPVCNAFSR
jgi:glutamyl-tRNA reductase